MARQSRCFQLVTVLTVLHILLSWNETTHAQVSRAIRGVVCDQKSRPIPGARIWVVLLSPPPIRYHEKTAVSGPAGRFSMPWHRPESGVLLKVAAKGHGPILSRAPVNGDVRLTLPYGYPVQVLVHDKATDTPVANAMVRVFTEGWSAVLDTPPTATSSTDEKGMAKLTLGVGEVTFVVLAEGHGPVALENVNVGKEGKSVAIPVDRGGTIEGTVLDRAGKPVVDVVVKATAIPGYYQTRITDKSGRFRFSDLPHAYVPPKGRVLNDVDQCKLEFRHKNFAPARSSVELPGPGKTGTTSMGLEKGRSLVGTVCTPDGKPVPGVWVMGSWTEFPARTDYNGTYLFRHVPNWPVTVTIMRRENVYRTIQLDAKANGAVPELRIVMAPQGKLPLRVIDAAGKPLAGGRVDLVRKDERSDVPRPFQHLDSRGEAVFEIQPGKITVLVEGSGLAPHYEEVDCTTPPYEMRTIQLPAGEVSGRVVLHDGSPARVWLYLNTHVPLTASKPFESRSLSVGIHGRMETDEKGRFRFRGVGPGKFRLRICNPDFMRVLDGPDEVQAGDTDLEIVVGDSSK